MYYSKYIKYKTKYLNLQSGGMHAPDEAPNHITSNSSLKTDNASTLPAATQQTTTRAVDDTLIPGVNTSVTHQTVDDRLTQVIDPTTFDYVIEQFCCKENTQFPKRLWACSESTMHNAAGAASSLASMTGMHAGDANLDGVVLLTHAPRQSYPPLYMTNHIVQMIKDDHNKEYISDHDGINVTITQFFNHSLPIEFNIITHNLEGLCSKDTERYDIIKKKLKSWFHPHIKPGTLLVLQEIALQMHMGPEEQTKILDTNFQIVLEALKSRNGDLKGKTDDYTGGMIYDSKVWELSETVRIQREGSSKFSNAYLMKYINEPYHHIWLINIHLAAPTKKLKDFFDYKTYLREYANNMHIPELQNIIDTVLRRNHTKYPVYLCGDFNNHENKATLITKVLQNLYIELKMEIANSVGADEYTLGEKVIYK